MCMRFYQFSVIFRCTMHLWFFLIWNFRFSARTIRHFLYVRGRECVRPRSTTTDHLSPTALVHTAPPRHSRPVTANRPPSPPPPSSPPPTTLCTEIKELWDNTRECMYASTYDATHSLRYICLGVARYALPILLCVRLKYLRNYWCLRWENVNFELLKESLRKIEVMRSGTSCVKTVYAMYAL